jgi:hypothetical protein
MTGDEVVAAIQAIDGWQTCEVETENEVCEGRLITDPAEHVWLQSPGVIVIGR